MWQLLDTVARTSVQIVMSILIARHLGPASFGLFNYAVAFVALFNPFATFGMDRLLIRDFVVDASSHGKIMAGGFLIRVMGGMLIMPVACLLVWMLRPDNTLAVELVFILSLVPVLQALDVIDFWFQSRLDVRWVTFAKLFSLSVATAFRIALLCWTKSVVLFALASLTEAVFKSIAVWFVYRPRRPANLTWTVDFSYVRKLMSEAWPLAVSLVFYFIYIRADQVMLGIMVGDAAVGIFSVGVKLYEGFLPLLVIVNTSLYPALVKLHADAPVRFWQRYEQISLVYSVAGWVITMGLLFFREPLVHFLFGASYARSADVLGISSFALFIMLPAALRSGYLTMSGQQKMLMWGTVLGAVLNVALNLVLIPRCGVIGSAWATVISQVISLYLSNIFFAGTRRLFWLQARAMLIIPSLRKVMKQMIPEAC